MRTRRSPAGAVALLAAAACNPGVVLRTDQIPDDTQWIAILYDHDGGRVDAVSPLLPWHEGVTAPEPSSAVARYWVAAFRAEDLEGLMPDSAVGAGAEALSPVYAPDPCTPVLGAAPAWLGYAEGEGILRPVATSSAPALTAGWLARGCPAVGGGALLAADRGQLCPATASQDDCALEVRAAAGCPSVSLRVDRRGAVCAPPVACVNDAAVAASIDAVASLSCADGTGYDVLASRPFAAAVEVAAIDVLPGMGPPDPGRLSGSMVIEKNEGFLTDLALLGDRVIVASQERWVQPHCRPEPGTPQSKLRVFDLDGLGSITTATAPPCLIALHPDPAGPGAIGLANAADLRRLAVLRTNDGGAPLESVDLPVDGALEAWAVDLIEDGSDPDRLVALVGWRRSDGVSADLYGVRVRGALGSPVRLARIDGVDPIAIRALSGGRFAVLDKGVVDRIVIVEAGSRTRHLPLAAAGAAAPAQSRLPSHLVVVADPLRLVVSDAGPQEALQLVDVADGRSVNARPYERDAFAQAMHRWPGDQGLVLVASTERAPAREAFLSLLDPRGELGAPHFLPGLLPSAGGAPRIGFGVVSRIEEDAAGRLWLLLPWSARLVRLTPR